MDKYVIFLKDNLTSHVFYNKLLSQLHDYYAVDGEKQLVFDFSQIKSIDPTVIPNLLCVGYIICSYGNLPAELIVSNNISHSELKRYLNEIKFVQFAEKYNLFTFDSAIKGGWDNSKMGPLNTTLLFNSNESEETTWSKLIKVNNFINKYLKEFDVYEYDTNLILEVSKEIVQNSKSHGRSFSFMTLQYNYQKEKVYLSFSDCGIGFLNSFIEKGLFLDNELEAIAEGVFSRNGKPFGLYNTITRVIKKGGVVRIHSNNTQVVLSSKDVISLEIIKDKNNFINLMGTQTNVRKHLKYAGVHIEIEIPMEKRACL